MTIQNDAGEDLTVNLKLTANEALTSFTMNATDIDIAVESFYNVAEDTDGIITSGNAGDFIKIDNIFDVALGNGGDDTYIVGSQGGGTALEYGDLSSTGELTGTIDAVNFNSVTSVNQLTFSRGQDRNEEVGNSLFISDGGTDTVLFDNYNEYLDFRRIEYLTIEDGANNDEIYEIVTGTNLEEWDNEIYVSHASDPTIDVELGGKDYVFGSDAADTFNVKLADIMSSGSGTIDLSNVTSDDTINVTDAASAGMGEDDIALMNATLNAGLASGGGEITFSYSEGTLTLDYASLDGLSDIDNQQYELDAISLK